MFMLWAKYKWLFKTIFTSSSVVCPSQPFLNTSWKTCPLFNPSMSLDKPGQKQQMHANTFSCRREARFTCSQQWVPLPSPLFEGLVTQVWKDTKPWPFFTTLCWWVRIPSMAPHVLRINVNHKFSSHKFQWRLWSSVQEAAGLQIPAPSRVLPS